MAWFKLELCGLGGWNGLFSVIEDIMNPKFGLVDEKLKIQRDRTSYKIITCIITFVLIDFTWIFFRAESFMQAVSILRTIGTDFRPAWLLNLEFLNIGDSRLHMIILISLMIMMLVDTLQYKKIDIKTKIFRQHVIVRWCMYFGLLFIILFWGHYGESSGQTAFIYFQF